MTLPIVTSFLHGIMIYLKGLSWLKRNPLCLFALFVPIILATSLIVLGLMMLTGSGFFLWYTETFYSWFLFTDADSWWMSGINYTLKAAITVLAFGILFLFSLLLSNIAASPIYDWVSQKVESSLTGKPAADISLWRSFLLIKEEIKKAIFVFLASTIILFIPVLNLLAPITTAFFLGWNIYDYPLARRAWSFRRRSAFTFTHFWSIAGFGLWLTIPFLQIFLMPLAVVGGTMLATEHLKNKQQS